MILDTAPFPARRCLRISLVTETYPPDINGVALTLARWVESLQHRGHDLNVVCVRARTGKMRADGVETLEVAGFGIPGYPQLQGGWPASRLLQTHWQRRRPDLVHIATEGPLGYSALRTARRLRIPVSTSFHTHFEHYSRHYRLGWLADSILSYLRHFHDQAAQTLVPTEALADQLRTLGFQRVGVVGRGVDTALFAPHRRDPALRARWGMAPHALAVLCAGRLAAEKNLELAIHAYQAIGKLRADTRFILVGDGPLTPRLRARHPDFVYCGMRQGEDLAAHYASADVFLFPSLTETFGNVVLEAMASALPIVAFDYAAARCHLHSGHSALLAPFGDAGTFITAATALAGDAALREHLGRGARQAAIRLDSQLVYHRLERSFLHIARGEESPCPTASLTT